MTEAEIKKLISEFEGKTNQEVPRFSAVRVKGRRLYEYAREGKATAVPFREVQISCISLLSYAEPLLKIRVVCSKGTYIRSLAHAIGERIGSGGYLAGLNRVSVGSVQIQAALGLDQIAGLHKSGELAMHLLPLEQVLDYGAVTVDEEFRRAVVNGPPLRPQNVVGIEGRFAAGDEILLKGEDGMVLAIGTAGADSDDFDHASGGLLFKYVRVLN